VPWRTGRPIAILHTFFYYGGFLAVVLLKAAGRYPQHAGAAATWNKASFVGWHVPNIVHGGIYGWIALCLAWELWLTGDAKLIWGPITQHAAVDVGTWFMVFVCMDTVLPILLTLTLTLTLALTLTLTLTPTLALALALTLALTLTHNSNPNPNADPEPNPNPNPYPDPDPNPDM
jgi:hypothetical protein